MRTYENCGGSPRRVRSVINSLGCVVSNKNVKADIIRNKRDVMRNALKIVSNSTLKGPMRKTSVVPPGIKMLCITNIKPTVGSINLTAILTKSQKSLEAMER